MAAWIRPQRSATSDLQRRLDHDDYVQSLPRQGETGAAPSQRPTGQAAEDGNSSSRPSPPGPDNLRSRLLIAVCDAMEDPECWPELRTRLLYLRTELAFGHKEGTA